MPPRKILKFVCSEMLSEVIFYFKNCVYNITHKSRIDMGTSHFLFLEPCDANMAVDDIISFINEGMAIV